MSLRDRVLTDPVIAAAWKREQEALRAWTQPIPATQKERRLREQAYVAAYRETSRLLGTRMRIDPLSPSEKMPS